jgi:hypothetical protein
MDANSNDPIDPNTHKNAVIIDWERTRSAIEHENELTNHRFTWLLATQGFLFTAFWYLTQPTPSTVNTLGHPGLGAVVVIAGMVFAAVLGNSLGTAEEQHESLRNWFDERYKDVKEDHPPIAGKTPRPFGQSFGYSQWPFMFIIAWIEAGTFTFSDVARASEIWLAPAIALVSLLIFLLGTSKFAPSRIIFNCGCKICSKDGPAFLIWMRDVCTEKFNKAIADFQKRNQN